LVRLDTIDCIYLWTHVIKTIKLQCLHSLPTHIVKVLSIFNMFFLFNMILMIPLLSFVFCLIKRWMNWMKAINLHNIEVWWRNRTCFCYVYSRVDAIGGMVNLLVHHLWTCWFTASIINELAGSTRYGEPVGSTTVNSLVQWQIINHSFKNHTLQLFTFKHTISKRIKITNQLSSVNVKHLVHFCPSTQYKAYSWLYIGWRSIVFVACAIWSCSQ